MSEAAVDSTPSSASSKARFAAFGGGGVACSICTKTAYPAETQYFEQKPYHRDCFRCTTCKKDLDAPTANIFDNKLYCKMCFAKGGFARKQAEVKWSEGDKKTSDSNASLASKFGGGGNPCTKCGKTVYAGETVQYEQKVYHPKCFTCSDCNIEIPMSDANQFESKIYCKMCWKKGKFNEKQLALVGAGAAAGAGAQPKAASYNPRFANLGGGGSKCYTCGKTVYPAETVQYEQRPYHAKCFKCCHCSKEILMVSQAEHKGDKVYCNKCFMELGLWQATLNETPK